MNLGYVEPRDQVYWSPSEVRTYMDEVNGAVADLVQDAVGDHGADLRATPAGARLFEEIQSFTQEWSDFYVENREGLEVWFGAARQTTRFVERYNALWQRFIDLGFDATRQGYQPHENPGLPWYAWAGIAIAATFAIGWVASSVSKVAVAYAPRELEAVKPKKKLVFGPHTTWEQEYDIGPSGKKIRRRARVREPELGPSGKMIRKVR